MTDSKRSTSVDETLTYHKKDLRRLDDRQNRLETQLTRLDRRVSEAAEQITSTHRALWESMVEINTQVGIVKAQIGEVKSLMDLVQAAVQAQEKQNHGHVQYSKGRRIGWREGFWAGGGALLAAAGVKYDAVINFLRSLGSPGG